MILTTYVIDCKQQTIGLVKVENFLTSFFYLHIRNEGDLSLYI